MDYIEYRLTCAESQRDLLSVLAWEAGAEGVEELDHGLSVFFSAPLPDPEVWHHAMEQCEAQIQEKIQHEAKNWNAQWESDFQPILTSKGISVRAPFHPPPVGSIFDLLIQPKMSFGTGHHETTRLVLDAMLDISWDKTHVFDFGCGTGVLGIMALKLGASEVFGIDIDDWAAENIPENLALNQVENFYFKQCGLVGAQGKQFDHILANINRNILLDSMKDLSNGLVSNGKLLMSGFFESDVQALQRTVEEFGLKLESVNTENQWAMMICIKQH